MRLKPNLRLAAVLVLLVLLLAALVYLFADRDSDPPPREQVPAEVPPAVPAPPRELPPPPEQVSDTYRLSGTLPALDASDEALFGHLSLLLSAVRLGLLEGDQFLRKLVLQIDNAARGQLIYQHSPLRAPAAALQAVERDGGLFLDPASHARYAPYAELATAVDPRLLVAYYRFYEPLLQEAYAELGYPPENFRSTLIAAIDQTLAAPLVEGTIELKQPEANYLYADPALESLNMVQKQLLRMGPENTAAIQRALQDFKARIQ
ncbi:MAG: DUF3014 domain-containing protein [Cellvibrionales bacterium]|nr:DUF3014 domain-containing protein [Cellvibrionales bacterium]